MRGGDSGPVGSVCACWGGASGGVGSRIGRGRPVRDCRSKASEAGGMGPAPEGFGGGRGRASWGGASEAFGGGAYRGEKAGSAVIGQQR